MIFHSYVGLPEGSYGENEVKSLGVQWKWSAKCLNDVPSFLEV